jgi:phospholipid/cholesterol/gamma-HCH transport system substrate-binding protein
VLICQDVLSIQYFYSINAGMANIKSSGWITIVAVILGIAGILIYKYGYMVYKDYEYYTVYENVYGLQRSSPIVISGVRVGEVSEIDLTEKGLAKVTMSINKKTRIPKGTIAKLASASLIGSKNITLEISNSKELYQHLDIIPGMYDTSVLEMKDQIAPVIETAKYYISSSDTNLIDLKKRFNNGLKEELQHNIARINGDMSKFEKQSVQLNKNADGIIATVNKFSKLSGSVNKDIQSLNKTIKNTEKNTADFAKAPIISGTDSLRATVKNVSDNADKAMNSKTVKKLLSNDKDYDKASNTLKDADKDMKELKEAPPGMSLF